MPEQFDQLISFVLWTVGGTVVLLVIAYPFMLWDRAYRKKHPDKDVRQA